MSPKKKTKKVVKAWVMVDRRTSNTILVAHVRKFTIKGYLESLRLNEREIPKFIRVVKIVPCTITYTL